MQVIRISSTPRAYYYQDERLLLWHRERSLLSEREHLLLSHREHSLLWERERGSLISGDFYKSILLYQIAQ